MHFSGSNNGFFCALSSITRATSQSQVGGRTSQAVTYKTRKENSATRGFYWVPPEINLTQVIMSLLTVLTLNRFR